MSAKPLPIIVRLRVVCQNPPPTDDTLHFGLQNKAGRLAVGACAEGRALSFGLTVEAAPKAGALIFSGQYAHGTAEDRFLYLSYGRVAASGYDWVWRIKIALNVITPELIAAAAVVGVPLTAYADGRYAGRAGFIGGQWFVEDMDS